MSLDWKIGDKLLCIDAMPIGPWPTGLVAGQEYALKDWHPCKETFVAVGIGGACFCPHCGTARATYFHFAWRFIKQDPLLIYREAEERQMEKIKRHAENYNMGPRKLSEVLGAFDKAHRKILIHRGNDPLVHEGNVENINDFWRRMYETYRKG